MSFKTCSHEFCQSCFQEYFREKLNSNAIEIGCPQYRCTTIIDMPELKANVQPKYFDKLKRMMINDEVLKNENLFFCPTPDCGYLDIRKHEKG